MPARGSGTLALLAIIGWSAIAVAMPPESRRAPTSSQRRVTTAAYHQAAPVEELPPPTDQATAPAELRCPHLTLGARTTKLVCRVVWVLKGL